MSIGAMIDGMSRDGLAHMARTAEHAERYEDMCQVMKKLANMGGELSVEERNLLSVAYKNVVGARRTSLRSLSNEDNSVSPKIMELYTQQLQDELKIVCDEILNLLKDNLIIDGAKTEGNVFYLKMGADYYRYLAECIQSEKSHATNADEYYDRAYVIAKDTLKPTHPIRLGLALNYSVCKFEIVRDPQEACSLAKTAFDSAIAELDKLEEKDYKDSTLIMQLLRDNLTLWTQNNGQDDDDEN